MPQKRLWCASNRRLFASEQSLEEHFVETYAERPILREGHRAGRRALRLADVLAPGPRHFRAVGPAGSGKMGREQRRVAQGALIGNLAGLGHDPVRPLPPPRVKPEVVAAG